MTLTFDVYLKKTKLYYIFGAVTLVTLPTVAVCSIFNIQFGVVAPFIAGVFDGVIIAASFISIFFVTAMTMGLIRTYIKTGELVLAYDYVIIDQTKIPLTEAKDIKLKLGQWSRRHLGYISRNRNEITDKNGKAYNNRFVIKSYNDNLEFENVLLQWQANGVVFDWKYYAFP